MEHSSDYRNINGLHPTQKSKVSQKAFAFKVGGVKGHSLKDCGFKGKFFRVKGFTLIEMLIALAIGASVSVMAYQSLSSAIRADEKVTRVMTQIDEMDRVWQYMNNDFLYAVNRTWVDRGGEAKSAMMGVFGDRLSQSDALIASEDDYLLQFIRSNRTNLLNQARSDLYMVGYRLTQETDSETKSLWRDTWTPVDGSGEPVLQQRRLLDGIKDMRFRYLSASFHSMEDSWVTGWPASSRVSDKLPAAVEVAVDSSAMGEIVRRFGLSVTDD